MIFYLLLLAVAVLALTGTAIVVLYIDEALWSGE